MYQKYLKYKTKYLLLKNSSTTKFGGSMEDKNDIIITKSGGLAGIVIRAIIKDNNFKMINYDGKIIDGILNNEQKEVIQFLKNNSNMLNNIVNDKENKPMIFDGFFWSIAINNKNYNLGQMVNYSNNNNILIGKINA